MADTMVIVTEIEDEEKRSTVWHTLANALPDLTTEHCCEIDTSTWDDGAWREWEMQMTMLEDVLDVDVDIVIIWYVGDGQVERQILGISSHDD